MNRMEPFYRILAIDPGINGAFAIILRSKSRVDEYIVWDTPTFKTRQSVMEKDETLIELKGVRNIIFEYGEEIDLVVIEKLLWFKKDGRQQTLISGVNFGRWTALVDELEAPIRTIEPGVWKAAMGLDQDKSKSLNLAREMFPKLAESHLSRKKDHDCAEALLMADYAFWSIIVAEEWWRGDDRLPGWPYVLGRG